MTSHARPSRARPLSPLSISLAALTLAACGGGGGDGDGAVRDDVPEECQFLVDQGLLTAQEVIDAGCLIAPDDGVDPGVAPTGDGDEPVDDGGDLAEDVAEPPVVTDDPVAAAEPGLELADLPGSDFYAVANNTAVLQGPVLGEGTTPNASLARSLPFRVESAEAGLELLHASVVPREDGSAIVAIVANRSAEFKCFVKIDDYVISDTAGRALGDDLTLDFNFADGVVGDTGLSITDTCIGPDSLAYMLDLIDVTPETIGAVTIGALTSTGRGDNGLLPDAIVEPLSYAVDSGDAADTARVLLANRGLVEVEVTLTRMVLLDEAGFPLGVLFQFGGPTLAPGAEEEIRFTGRFTGSVSTARVIVDFEPIEP